MSEGLYLFYILFKNKWKTPLVWAWMRKQPNAPNSERPAHIPYSPMAQLLGKAAERKEKVKKKKKSLIFLFLHKKSETKIDATLDD